MSDAVAANYGKALTLAETSEDELFRLAAIELGGRSFGLGSADLEAIKARVEKWWADYRGVLHKHLCTDELRFLLEPTKGTREKALIIVAVADCLAGVTTGLSPFTASSLIAHFGLRRLCGG